MSTLFKTIGYAYPSSHIAGIYRRSRHGCWFVELVTAQWVREEILEVFSTKEDAQAYADALPHAYFNTDVKIKCVREEQKND